MKSKNKALMFLCLLVTLFSIRPSFANADDQNQPSNQQTDIKSGDEITITEEPLEMPQVQIEEKKVHKADGIKLETNKTENKSSPTIDPRASEVNERVNKKYREEQKAKENQQTQTKTESRPQTKVQTQSNTHTPRKIDQETKDEVEALIKELDQNTRAIQAGLDNSNSHKSSKQSNDYKKAVELVGEVMLSDKITKAESEKIANSTKKIVADYNKKIEKAATSEEKEALMKEASQRINDNLKSASEEAYESAKKNEVSIYDQKNETLVLEIEPSEREESKKEKKNIKVTKTTSLEKSPKLASEDKEKPFFKVAIGVFVVLIISLAISISLVLKNRKNLRK